jgi:hypothetical protein
MDWSTQPGDPLADLNKILREQRSAPSPLPITPGQAAALLDIRAHLDGFPSRREAFTVELEDETDPEGSVVVRDAQGTPVAHMPQRAWDAIAARK